MSHIRRGRRDEGPNEGGKRASLPLAALGEPHILRTTLEAISVTFTGPSAGANTVRRKRAVLHHLLEHAVEQKVFDSNPLDGIKWTAPKAVTVVDPRTVVNPAEKADHAARHTGVRCCGR